MQIFKTRIIYKDYKLPFCLYDMPIKEIFYNFPVSWQQVYKYGANICKVLLTIQLLIASVNNLSLESKRMENLSKIVAVESFGPLSLVIQFNFCNIVLALN